MTEISPRHAPRHRPQGPVRTDSNGKAVVPSAPGTLFEYPKKGHNQKEGDKKRETRGTEDMTRPPADKLKLDRKLDRDGQDKSC